MQTGVSRVLFALATAGPTPWDAARALGVAYYVDDDLGGTPTLSGDDFVAVQRHRKRPELERFWGWSALIGVVSRRYGVQCDGQRRLGLIGILMARRAVKSTSGVLESFRKVSG